MNINSELEEKEFGTLANQSFMHECAISGNANMMKLLIEHKAIVDVIGDGFGPELPTWVKGTGVTPLILAAFHGRDECLSLLIESKADVKFQTTVWEDTALHNAAKYNHEKCVKLLLAANANLTVKDRDGDIPFQLAKENSVCADLIKQAMEKKGLPIPTAEKQCLIQ